MFTISNPEQNEMEHRNMYYVQVPGGVEKALQGSQVLSLQSGFHRAGIQVISSKEHMWDREGKIGIILRAESLQSS